MALFSMSINWLVGLSRVMSDIIHNNEWAFKVVNDKKAKRR